MVGAVLALGSTAAGAASGPASCGMSIADGNIIVQIDDDEAGKWAVNLRKGTEYVYLGRHKNTTISVAMPADLSLGTWKVQARAVRPDGSKEARGLCGTFTVDGSAPPPPVEADFTCYAIETGLGEASAAVVASEPFGDASLNFRDSRWIATDDPPDRGIYSSERSLRRLPTKVIVRQGSKRIDVPCTDAIFGGVDIPPSFPGLTTAISVTATYEDYVVWGIARLSEGTFRYSYTNFLTKAGEDAVAIGGRDYQISTSTPLCDGRILGFDAFYTDDPGSALGVIDPVAGVMWVSNAEAFGDLVVDCSSGLVTASDGFITDTYQFQ